MEQQKLFDCKPDYDSKEELMFSYYLDELVKIGMIDAIEYQPESFDLFSGHKAMVSQPKRKGFNQIEIELMKPKLYTADWKITWNPRAKGVLIFTDGDTVKGKPTVRTKTKPFDYIPFYHDDLVSYVDVKGGAGASFGGSNTSAVTFSTNQKWVYAKFGVYVAKTVITLDSKGLFAKTFTPRQVVIDEVYKKDTRDHKKGGWKWREGDSKLRYQPILLEEYLRHKIEANG